MVMGHVNHGWNGMASWMEEIAISSIQDALRSMKKKRNPDRDGISHEHLKYNLPAVNNHLQLLFQMILSTSVLPESFLLGTVTPVLKRGKDADQCSSYRPITVSCILSKIFEYTLAPEIISKCDFGSLQYGFRKQIGCSHAHRSLLQILKEATAKRVTIHLCAIDIAGAFDNVNHVQALMSLVENGVNRSIILALKSWYSRCKLIIKWRDMLSDPITVQKGVPQGRVLSPQIFKCAISQCLRKLSQTYNFRGIDVSYLAYADDILLISKSKKGLEANVASLNQSLNKIGLSMNASKCQYVCFNPPASPKKPSINIGCTVIETEEKMRWLGISIGQSLRSICEEAIKSTANGIRFGYSKIVPNRSRYNRQGLGKLYNAFCAPYVNFLAGLHGILRKKDLHRIRSTYFKYLRFLLYLPRRTRNRYLIRRLLIQDPLITMENLSSKLNPPVGGLPVHHPIGLLLICD